MERIRQLAATSASAMNDHCITNNRDVRACSRYRAINPQTHVYCDVLSCLETSKSSTAGRLSAGAKTTAGQRARTKKFLRYVDAVEDALSAFLKRQP